MLPESELSIVVMQSVLLLVLVCLRRRLTCLCCHKGWTRRPLGMPCMASNAGAIVATLEDLLVDLLVGSGLQVGWMLVLCQGLLEILLAMHSFSTKFLAQLSILSWRRRTIHVLCQEM